MLAPFIRALRNTHPDDRIILVCRHGLGDLANLFPIDQVIQSNRPSLVARNAILRAAPDGINHCYVCFAGAWLTALTTIPIDTIVSYPEPKGRWTHLIDETLKFPQKLTPLPELVLRFSVGAHSNSPPLDIWEPQQGVAVLHLGARNPARQLSLGQTVSLITALNMRGFTSVLLTGEASEGISNHEIYANLSNNAQKPTDLRGKVALHEMPKIISHARLLISVDTGIVHLAKALGTPTLVLLGQSQPILFGIDNLHSRSRHFVVDNLDCRDKKTLHGIQAKWINTCGKRTCPLPRRACLPDPLPTEFYDALDFLIKETE